MENPLNFNPFDLAEMKDIMDKHGDSKTMYPGVNENGETVFISIYHDRIVVSTMQDNGWNRINTYYRDGSSDETFDGKWR
jgi:hypothetical protein